MKLGQAGYANFTSILAKFTKPGEEEEAGGDEE
jgi:hypothetical protein